MVPLHIFKHFHWITSAFDIEESGKKVPRFKNELKEKRDRRMKSMATSLNDGISNPERKRSSCSEFFLRKGSLK